MKTGRSFTGTVRACRLPPFRNSATLETCPVWACLLRPRSWPSPDPERPPSRTSWTGTRSRSGRPQVRLVQIDTPEVGSGECYARRAAKDLRRLLRPARVSAWSPTAGSIPSTGTAACSATCSTAASTSTYAWSSRATPRSGSTPANEDRYAAGSSRRRAERERRGAASGARARPSGIRMGPPRPRQSTSAAGRRDAAIPPTRRCAFPRLRPTSTARRQVPTLQGRGPRPAPLRRRPRRNRLRELTIPLHSTRCGRLPSPAEIEPSTAGVPMFGSV